MTNFVKALVGCFCFPFLFSDSARRGRQLHRDISKWTTLPPDLLLSVARRLPIPEQLRLRAICTSWANALKDSHPFTRSNRPWLLLTDYGDDHKLSLMHPDDELQSCHLPFLPELNGKVWCAGSKDGWLVVLNKLKILLFNPITGEKVSFPSFYTQSGIDHNDVPCVGKIILSAIPGNTTNSSIIAMAATRDNNIAYAESTDRNWTPVPISPDNTLRDIVYYDGMFCVLCSGPNTWELSGADFVGRYRRSQLTMLSLVGLGFSMQYEYNDRLEEGSLSLVSSPTGDLLQVLQIQDPNSKKCTKFIVMAFRPGGNWVEVEDLGGYCLFVDTLQSTSHSAADAADGLKENCIYFANLIVNPSNELVMDTGIFDLRRGIIEPCLTNRSCLDDMSSKFPFWFKPSLS